MERHHILEQDPIEQQMKRPEKTLLAQGSRVQDDVKELEIFVEAIPRSSNWVEGGYDARNVDGSPFGNVYLRDKDRQRKNNAVEEEREHVSYDLSDKEEAINHIELLEQGHFLQEPIIISSHYILRHQWKSKKQRHSSN